MDFIDYNAADGEEMYEPGCKIYVDGQKRTNVVQGRRTELKATLEARRKWSRPWNRLSSYSGAFNLTPQLPEAYAADQHLILLGDSQNGRRSRLLQASEATRSGRYTVPRSRQGTGELRLEPVQAGKKGNDPHRRVGRPGVQAGSPI